MRNATAQEHFLATSRQHTERDIVYVGPAKCPRQQIITHKYCGVEVGRQVNEYSRGKLTGCTYEVDPDFLTRTMEEVAQTLGIPTDPCASVIYFQDAEEAKKFVYECRRRGVRVADPTWLDNPMSGKTDKGWPVREK